MAFFHQGGIEFDLAPQAGGFLQTDTMAGVFFNDSGGGFHVSAINGGGVVIDSLGGGGYNLTSDDGGINIDDGDPTNHTLSGGINITSWGDGGFNIKADQAPAAHGGFNIIGGWGELRIQSGGAAAAGPSAGGIVINHEPESLATGAIGIGISALQGPAGGGDVRLYNEVQGKVRIDLAGGGAFTESDFWIERAGTPLFQLVGATGIVTIGTLLTQVGTGAASIAGDDGAAGFDITGTHAGAAGVGLRLKTTSSGKGSVASPISICTPGTTTPIIKADVGAKLGFFNVAPIARPDVSGSRADPEQALKDLCAELALLGLITDSTTA